MSAIERFYDWPPVKGTLSVALLVGMGALSCEIDDLALILAVEAVILLAAVYIWSTTLSGFLRDLRPPDGPDGMIAVASRPRRAAVAIAWGGLVLAAVATPIAGAVVIGPALAPAPVTAAVLTASLAGLVIATALPSRSRTKSARAGGIGVSAQGVRVVSPAHQDEAPEPFPEHSAQRPDADEVRASMGRLESLAAPDVRWHPGAREAVARWMADGFLPTLAETRALHLDPAWSPDPRSHEPTRAQRWGRFLRSLWMVLIMAFFGALLFGALIEEGTLRDGNWFVLLAFGWIPVVGAPIFVVQAIRVVRRVPRDAGVSARGWFDVRHDRGLIPFDQITGMQNTADGLEVQLTDGTLTYPPLEDTLACARRAARDFEVPYEVKGRTS
ncbi:hypothetical protein [Brachybacterium sp. AOP3-A1-3]|uniref:hypothetical protein n=1 Tax=Brachybacterium sp. AOP3-A1-3 TaxID=3457699 RepID=UPI0040332885